MTFRVEIAATARADLLATTRWLRDENSPAAARPWLAGIFETIRSLEKRPLRCPKARESENLSREIRELYHGRQKHAKYRILFEMIGDVVFVIYVRHSSRDELEP